MVELKEKVKQILLQQPKSYAEAKAQSAAIDLVLDFQVESIEEALRSVHTYSKQTWSELHPQAHQTPYYELKEICAQLDLNAISSIVDLGAGYGRLGIILHWYYPQIQFYGFELVQERVNEGNRVYKNLGMNCELKTADIADSRFKLPDGDLYYVYDFGSDTDMEIVLENLQSKAQSKLIRVLARGRGFRQKILLNHPWLSQVVEPIHTQHWSLFTSQ